MAAAQGGYARHLDPRDALTSRGFLRCSARATVLTVFLRGPNTAEGGGKRETLAVLSTHLRADKNLSPETVDALQDLLGAVERLMDAGGKLPEDGQASAEASMSGGV